MKKQKIITVTGIIIGVIVSMSISALAGYYSIGVGNGGDAEAKNLSLEVGSKNLKIREKPFLAALGITVIDHGDKDIPPETKNEPCLYDDYTSLGQKPDGVETGLLGKLGLKNFHPDLYFSVLGGITQVNEIHLTQSNKNPEVYYVQSSGKEYYGVYGISIGYFPELFAWKLKLNMQIDYDNRRGVTGYLGWCW